MNPLGDYDLFVLGQNVILETRGQAALGELMLEVRGIEPASRYDPNAGSHDMVVRGGKSIIAAGLQYIKGRLRGVPASIEEHPALQDILFRAGVRAGITPEKAALGYAREHGFANLELAQYLTGVDVAAAYQSEAARRQALPRRRLAWLAAAAGVVLVFVVVRGRR